MSKKVILTGATGEIGTPLGKALIARGDELIVFSRDPEAARTRQPGARDYVRWQAEEAVDWMRHIDGVDAVINCAGINIFSQRYRGAFAREAVNSRLLGTRGLINAMRTAAVKPSVFINSSSQGYYGLRDFDERVIDENSPAGSGDQWAKESVVMDAEAFQAEAFGVRVVSMRTGYVLDAHGGGLVQQVAQLRKGQGGATTPLDAWRSWIHIDDLVGLYLFALDHEQVHGGLNGTAPQPVISAQFATLLSQAVLGKPNTRTFPGFLLRLFIGPAADMMTYGKQIIPKKALDLGFRFQYPTLPDALANLVPQIAT